MLVSVVLVCALAAVGAGGAAAGTTARVKVKPVAAATWDCTVLMPASSFDALTGGRFTAGPIFRSAPNLVSNCRYGTNLVMVDAKTGLKQYGIWVAGATQSTRRDAANCRAPQVDDLRDCRLQAVTGLGKEAAEFNRSIVVLTAKSAFVQVYSQDRTLSYVQLEAVARALLAELR
ncbi:MAG TPA: hypothetical protein VHD91_01510 [Gaiellaceae bacterium]|nr:hypothetical protein [Gaiellaceae bacterium]